MGHLVQQVLHRGLPPLGEIPLEWLLGLFRRLGAEGRQGGVGGLGFGFPSLLSLEQKKGRGAWIGGALAWEILGDLAPPGIPYRTMVPRSPTCLLLVEMWVLLQVNCHRCHMGSPEVPQNLSILVGITEYSDPTRIKSNFQVNFPQKDHIHSRGIIDIMFQPAEMKTAPGWI